MPSSLVIDPSTVGKKATSILAILGASIFWRVRLVATLPRHNHFVFKVYNPKKADIAQYIKALAEKKSKIWYTFCLWLTQGAFWGCP
jgi:hypothetical protein